MKGVPADAVEQLAEMLDRSLAAWLVSNSPLPFAYEADFDLGILSRRAAQKLRYGKP
jgi:hypothetical protein